MFDAQCSPATRRYQRRVLTASLLYAAALFAVAWLFRRQPELGALRYPLALLPALPIVAIVAALGRYLVEETDEYLRAQMVIQILWATGGALTLTTLWGFLESYSDVPHLPGYFTAIIWFGCFGLAALLLRWRTR